MQGAVWKDSMSGERQQGDYYQRLLFEQTEESPRHGAGGDGGTEAAAHEESQPLTAFSQARALTEHLMEEVTSRANLNRAYERVLANKGAAGVDGMTVRELYDWLIQHKQELLAS